MNATFVNGPLHGQHRDTLGDGTGKYTYWDGQRQHVYRPKSAVVGRVIYTYCPDEEGYPTPKPRVSDE